MLWFLLACSSEPDITVSPAEVDLGTVDFAMEMPEEGYAPQPVTLSNVGKHDVTLTMLVDDPDHLCVQGFTTYEPPYEMGVLPSGMDYVFQVAACDYEAGERDSEVETSLTVGTDAEPASIVIPVTFIPTRTIDDGTTG